MPRKRIKPEPEGRPEGYEILIGFIKDFIYVDPQDLDVMQGHPKIGRCYRIIKDSHGYRIHIGRENNDRGMDGLYLGLELTGKTTGFKYNIEAITPANYLELKINKEDTKQVAKWISTDNADMWEKLRSEADGSATVLRRLSEVLNLKDEIEHDIEKEVTSVKFAAGKDDSGEFHPQDIVNAERLSVSLNTISYKDPAMFFAILDTLEYIAGTYDDKYNSPDMPNFTKTMLTRIFL